MERILLIRKINMQNANALSSPFTVGFPALTSWLGAVHALQRQLMSTKFDKIQFKGVGVVCHDFHLKVIRDSQGINYIRATANPLSEGGNKSSFIPEIRCDVSVSLVIRCEEFTFNRQEEQQLIELISQRLACMKIAGGDIILAPRRGSNIENNFFHPDKLQFLKIEDDKDIKELSKQLMPGYVLYERRDLMKKSMEEEKDAIDAMIDNLAVVSYWNSEKSSWMRSRKNTGWIVPIAVGFQGLTDISVVSNQRDAETPHRFAESVVTLGEFKTAYRLDFHSMFWYANFYEEKNLYLCEQKM